MQFEFSDKLKNLKPSAIREIFKSLSDPNIISFAAGNPSPLSFPVEELQRLGNDIFANESTAALQYSITEGYPKLREAVAARIKAKFDIGNDYDQTIITSGGQQGIELVCKALCNEGDTVVCENPSFIGALNSFRSCGAKTVGVPLQDDGIDVDALDKMLAENKKIKLIYVIPTFQNPAGITTSYEKRVRLLEIAEKYNVPILEDNPYGELRFAGKDIPTIKSMDTKGIVVYCSSFSKLLSAGMRVGYLCAHKDLISKVTVAKQSEDVHTNIFFQMLVYKYMTECDLDAHIKKINDLYRAKCGLMLESLDKYMPACVKYTRPEGGLFIWCTLPDEIDMNAFVKAALAHECGGVAVVPGTAFNCDTEAPSKSFRLNYSTPSDEQIVTGIKALGEVVSRMMEQK